MAWMMLCVGVPTLLVTLVLVAEYVRFKFQSQKSFKGATVVITGGSTGIGKACAVALAREGASNIVILARTKSALENAKSEIEQHFPKQNQKQQKQRVLALECDVTDPQQVVSVADQVLRECGTPHFVFACAGLAFPGRFLEQPLADFERTMKLNYFGALYTAKEFLPHMVSRKSGHIVFFSSTAGLMGISGYSTYCPTKFALRGLADTLRNELCPHNIDVSVVYPPDTDTPGFAQENLTKPDDCREISAQGPPPIRPEAMASTVISGVKRRLFNIVHDPITHLMCTASSGVSPNPYPLLDTLLLPIASLVCFIARIQTNSIVRKHAKKSVAATSTKKSH